MVELNRLYRPFGWRTLDEAGKNHTLGRFPACLMHGCPLWYNHGKLHRETGKPSARWKLNNSNLSGRLLLW